MSREKEPFMSEPEREFEQVIFLDIDGVLNRRGTQEHVGRFMGIDEELLQRFRRLLGRVNAHVVLSSTWRLFPELRAEVERRLPILDVTPELRGESRGTEIRAWLAFNPEVERYAIIDDDRDMLPDQTAFFTDTWVGLTEEIADAVAAHLTAPLAVPAAPSLHPQEEDAS